MKKTKYLFFVLLTIASLLGFYFIKRGSGHKPHFIPAFTLEPDEDMSYIVVYENRVYSEAYRYRLDKDIIDKILGTYLGSVTPSIDEYTRIDKIDSPLAGNMHANVYQVNGYAEEFRLCTHDKQTNRVYFYENLNGIFVERGSDIFIDRLCFDKQFTWDAADIYSYPGYHADVPGIRCELTKEDITFLYHALSSSEHILYDDILEQPEVICTLSIQMADNTIVEIHFYNDNYIDYGGVYFIMDDPIHDKIISLYR